MYNSTNANLLRSRRQIIELLETGVPNGPNVTAKITWQRKLEFLLTHSVWNWGESCARSLCNFFSCMETQQDAMQVDPIQTNLHI